MTPRKPVLDPIPASILVRLNKKIGDLSEEEYRALQRDFRRFLNEQLRKLKRGAR